MNVGGVEICIQWSSEFVTTFCGTETEELATRIRTKSLTQVKGIERPLLLSDY